MGKFNERLVEGQEVNATGALAWSILSPLKSARYSAFSTTTSSLFLRTMRTTSLVLLGVRSPAQRFQGGLRSGAVHRGLYSPLYELTMSALALIRSPITG